MRKGGDECSNCVTYVVRSAAQMYRVLKSTSVSNELIKNVLITQMLVRFGEYHTLESIHRPNIFLGIFLACLDQ